MRSLVVNYNLATPLISNIAIKTLNAMIIVLLEVVGRTTAIDLTQAVVAEEITITAILKNVFNFYKALNKKIPSGNTDGIFYYQLNDITIFPKVLLL